MEWASGLDLTCAFARRFVAWAPRERKHASRRRARRLLSALMCFSSARNTNAPPPNRLGVFLRLAQTNHRIGSRESIPFIVETIPPRSNNLIAIVCSRFSDDSTRQTFSLVEARRRLIANTLWCVLFDPHDNQVI